MWINDGNPEHVSRFLDKVLAVEGGYIMVLQLSQKEIRLVATNDPSRYLKAWRTKILRAGGSDIAYAWISPPHIKYEKIKRLLQAGLCVEDTISTVELKIREIFTLVQPHAGFNSGSRGMPASCPRYPASVYTV